MRSQEGEGLRKEGDGGEDAQKALSLLLERPCASQGASMLLRREGGFLRREGGFLRRGRGLLRSFV